ncbi:MAG: hypothetical protein QF569_06165 [Candidatus Poribacteria bacterium]|nr:hypothetical protein [Candidatus Poribacteria bacterium]
MSFFTSDLLGDANWGNYTTEAKDCPGNAISTLKRWCRLACLYGSAGKFVTSHQAI